MVSPWPGTDSRLRSGVEHYTTRLARALADAGAGVSVVAEQLSGEPLRSRSDGVEVVRVYRRGPGALATAARAVESLGADVAHVQHELFLFGGAESLPALPWALGRLRSRGPVVTMHQVVDPADVDRAFTRMHRVRVPAPAAAAALRGLQALIGRRAAATIVHEAALARLVPGARVVPHGTEVQECPDGPAAKAHLGLDRQTLCVLCFGYLAPYKGLETALEAARRAGPEVQLVVAGGTHPRLEGREDYAAALSARWPGTARMTGYVPAEEVGPWFAAADVVLLTHPRPFSSSGALALALGYGRPVLMSRAFADTIGAPVETAVAAGPGPLAERLRELARHPERLQRLGAASTELARGRSWPTVAERHLELYEEVIRERGSARTAVPA